MINIIIFSQNVILESLLSVDFNRCNCEWIFLTPHMLYENEKKAIEAKFGKCSFIKFGDMLSDEEAELCDKRAYDKTISLSEYYQEIKKHKNELILKKVLEKYSWEHGYLCSNDLGIYPLTWINAGFSPVELDYYFQREVIARPEVVRRSKIKSFIKKVPGVMKYRNNHLQKAKESSVTEEVYRSYYNGKKYIFIGKLSRVAYRMVLDWEKSEEDYNNIKNGVFETKKQCVYLSSLHEHYKSPIPDSRKYDIRIIQDGYLPPNYSSAYLKYRQGNERYYAWDALGKELFENHHVPVSIMPFRKKIFLQYPEFKNEVKTILVATSGPGDWTALKNRSDEDLMVSAFVEVAKRFPHINIIYRCHPTWTHPDHNGINSIHRVSEYLQYSGLTNIKLSGNIPQNIDNKELSFSRSSFEEDLKYADIVFGEHSVSMLDAGFSNIPFCSVNLTGRRDFFCGISQMGFPHCESIEEICKVLHDYEKQDFREQYKKSVDLYNAMTELK